MLKPYLVQISLQNRGEVITDRRVRLDEAEANGMYNALEALLLAETAKPTSTGIVKALRLARAYLVGGPSPERGTVLDAVTEALQEADPENCAHCGRPLAVCIAEQADIAEHNEQGAE